MQDDPGLWETEIGHLSLILKTKDVMNVFSIFLPPTHTTLCQNEKKFFFY